MIELLRPSKAALAVIRVLGIGGAGANALDRLLLDGMSGAELHAVNTDIQSLTASVATGKLQIGRSTTRGLGTGGDPELGYQAAEEGAEELRALLQGASMVFLLVGLGGGTGSGAAPLIANFAREQDALVVVFATLPFHFEGRRRMAQAEEALAALQQQADVVVCFENDRMGEAVSPRAPIHEAFAAADQTISQSVRAVSTLVNQRGLIHLGLDELTRTLRAQNARCIFGFGEASGDNRAHEALARALKSPLMDRGRLLGETASVLVNIAGGEDMTLNEVQILMEELGRHIGDDTRIHFGCAVDPQLGAKMRVTVLSAIDASAQLATAPKPTLAVVDAEPEPVITFVETDEAVTALLPAAELAAELAAQSPAAAAQLARRTEAAAAARAAREAKQEQMQFEPVTRGRFEKSEPTIVDGEDLDVPTFLRRNMKVR